MDLGKIGKFIAKLRQEKGLTQEDLAEELEISNRSVSKWERGICLPDAHNMTKLCKLFNVNYNELLSGTKLNKTTYEKRAEENLKDLAQLETMMNRKMFVHENIIGLMSTIIFITLLLIANLIKMPVALTVILIVLAFVFLLIGCSICLKIETEVGKYKCQKCGHLYVPKYSSVFLAPHFGRTRYMTCPKCHQKSWQKKKA